MIISLGGGTPCYANNHELLKQEGVISIYLKASIDFLLCLQCLVINDHGCYEEMKEFIAMHVFERSFTTIRPNTR
jgi:shikimate kinase